MPDPRRAEVEAWPAARPEMRPEMTAVEVVARLSERHPERFAPLHLRPTQRLAKAGREQQATRMGRLGARALTLPPCQEALVRAPPQAAAPGAILG